MRPASRPRSIAVTLFALVLFALVVAACTPAPAPAVTPAPPTTAPAGATSAPGGAAGTPKSGGTITMVIWQEPENLNTELTSQTVANHISDLWLEGLLNVNEKGQWFPVLATEVPTTANGGVSADGKTITYHLRKGVKWHDGNEYTCADLQFTQQVITTPNNGSLDASQYATVAVTCPDPNTAVLTFKDFKADWIRLFNGEMITFPKNAGKPEEMKTWAYNRKPIGTGPFKVDEFVTGDHITLSKNTNYWQPGKPYLDKIIIRIVPSSEVGLQMMKSGEADVMWNNTEADLPALAQLSNVKVFSAPQAGGERMILNLTQNADPSDNKTPHPILGDINVRQAIALGIDKQTIIDKLLNGKALPGSGELNVDPYNCGIKPVPYDPGKAKQLLDAAGWVPGSDGIRAKGGTRLSLKYQTTTGNKLREDSQVLVVENMKAIGVEFKIENQPSSVLIGSWSAGSPRKHGNFDIIMYTTNASIDPGTQMYNYFDSKSIPSPTNQGGINYSRWNDPQTDQLIEKAGSIPDWNQRKDLYCQAAQRVVDGYSHIYLYQRFNLHSLNNRVQGWIATPWLGPLWNATDIWVNK